MRSLLSVSDVAEYVAVPQSTVRRWVREGVLPSLRIGRLIRIRPEDLERTLERKQSIEQLDPTDPAGRGPARG